MIITDIADLDCVYLSYDEPRKEETWIKIQNIVPWAKRVDGVKGSDAAHKAAADASSTDRFVLIDKKGLVRGQYSGTDSLKVNQLIKDIELLKSEE